jgi:Domain of unknown function (DUF4326)
MAKTSRSGSVARNGNAALMARGPSLETCEQVIEAGLQTFYEVGRALAYIRDTELYRAGYITFHSYLKERWGFSFSYANRLIAGADVVTALDGTPVPPSSIGVAEELIPLPTSLRTEIWNEALATTKRKTNGQPNPTADEVHILVETKLAALTTPNQPQRAVLSEHDERVLERVRSGETLVANLRHQTELIERAEGEGLLVRVDRASRWGNPFVLDDDGSRDGVVEAYRDFYLPHKPSLQSRLPDLRGKLLACWCAPERCHGDVLAAAANSGQRLHDHD